MRTAVLALLATAAIALGGCAATSPAHVEGALPTDLPDNPNPNQRYCKVWVPPTYRKVPKLCKVDDGGMKCETVTVMETRAKEVCVKPPRERQVARCDTRCDETAVQVTPGGYRWEHDGNCWQYVYRPPEYKWCDVTRKEEGLKFCYTEPAEHEVVVESRPVQRVRKSYVPPKYEVKYVKEVYTPGRWEWRAEESCGKPPNLRECTEFTIKKDRRPACPQPKALDCGCPRTN